MSLFLHGWSWPVSARLIPLTNPFLINAESVGDQTVPRIFSLDDGGFVVVWYHQFLVEYHLSVDGPLDVEAVRGRVFDSDGTPRGSEFDLDEQKPPIYAASRGDSLVIRDDVGTERGLGRFDVDGTRLEHWSIADEVPDVHSQTSIARGRDRSIVVAWDESPFTNVVAQIFDENGRPRPQPKIVVALAGPPDNQGVINPLVAAADDGSFAVAWWAENSGVLWTRHFDGQGAPRGDRFAAAVHRISEGSFDFCMDRASASSVIVWDEQALRFSASVPGDPICTGLGAGTGPFIACAGEDRFVVAEHRYAYTTQQGPVFGSEYLLVLRAFGAANRVLGTALIPAPIPRVRPLLAFPHVASIGPGTIAVAWHDCSAPCRDLDGCSIGCEVYAQLFRLTDTPDCPGDCNTDGRVTIDELVTAVDLAVNGTAEEQADPTRCPALESGGDCRITVGEVVRAVRSGLEGCAR